MHLPGDYWSNYEIVVDDLSEFVSLVTQLSNTWPERRFVWRGVANADYALHSSLYRRLKAGGKDNERNLRAAEDAIVTEARRWWLQRGATDRLSGIELLAALQHQGVPTRLLDFSHNALVALWFAVEQKPGHDGTPGADTDGRIFAVQANGRDIPPDWERDPELPWRDQPDDWDSDISIWTPPPIDARMTRQQGCFIFGGVPSTRGAWNLSPSYARPLQRRQVRECVSVPVRLNSPNYLRSKRQRGRPPKYALAFTLRVPATAKPVLRNHLERGFGYTHAMLYPDFPGFASFGNSIVPR
jgi:FRG domain